MLWFYEQLFFQSFAHLPQSSEWMNKHTQWNSKILSSWELNIGAGISLILNKMPTTLSARECSCFNRHDYFGPVIQHGLMTAIAKLPPCFLERILNIHLGCLFFFFSYEKRKMWLFCQSRVFGLLIIRQRLFAKIVFGSWQKNIHLLKKITKKKKVPLLSIARQKNYSTMGSIITWIRSRFFKMSYLYYLWKLCPHNSYTSLQREKIRWNNKQM